MEKHIQRHSRLVAAVTTEIARLAAEKGFKNSNMQEARAAALLHDLAKTYTIRHGGNHSQIGGAWVQELTGNPAIAQAVMHHVYWPGQLDVRAHTLALAVIYGDKRVKHESIVTLDERFADLFERYGTDDRKKTLIKLSLDQARAIEAAFDRELGVDLNAYTFDSRRLVERT